MERLAARIITLACALCACGQDDNAPPAASPTALSAGVCADYCGVIVAQGPGCETYDADSRCKNICGFYAKSACKSEYEAYAKCLSASAEVSCFQPDAGRLTLVVESCHAEYQAFLDCKDARNVGFCPYE